MLDRAGGGRQQPDPERVIQREGVPIIEESARVPGNHRGLAADVTTERRH